MINHFSMVSFLCATVQFAVGNPLFTPDRQWSRRGCLDGRHRSSAGREARVEGATPFSVFL